MFTKLSSALSQIKAGMLFPFRWFRDLVRAHPKQSALWLLFALAPFLCFWMVEILSENSITSLAPWQWLMNLVWYACLLFIGWLITGGRRGAIAFDCLFSFFIGLANHYVLQFRGRALFPIDLLSLNTAANVAGSYDYTPDNSVWGALGILASVLFFLVLLPKERARYGGLRWAKWLNLGLSAAWCVYIGLFFFSDMLPSLGVYAQQWKTKGNGFLLNFTVSARYMRVEKPDGYTEEKAEELIQSLEDQGLTSDSLEEADTVTNFIVIMDESFADLTQFETLTLTGDPTPFYHALTENTIKGSMYSPVTGGGTAAVEFEVLTGNTMAFLPSGTVAYQLYLTENTPSLAQLASALDIRSSAYHPYLSSGWNRTTAYRHLGFDSQYYQDLVVDGEDITTEYSSDDLVRGYVSDSADFSRIYELTDAAKENGQDCFVFNVTMQNHSGYNKEWTNLNRSVSLDGEYTGNGYDSTTSQYLALASATDSALEELIEHYSQVEESTVILFFGDHQPALSNDLYRDIYGKDLDDRTMEELMQQYTTPFFLWANFDIEEAQDVSIGTSFLGVLASQLAGYPQTGYMKFLSQLNETFTAITPVGYVLSDGTVYETRDELGEEEQALLDQYEYLQYYNLFGGQTENGFFFVSDPDQSED